MLAYSIEKYLPTHSNIITLECEDVGFIYSGIKAYSSGILLTQNSKYNDVDKLTEITKPKNMFRRKSIEELYNKLPSPLKPLAFLLYQTKEDYKSFADQIGALSIILQTIHPTYWFETPIEQRFSLSFGSSLKSEYEYDWKVFFDSCIKYDDLINPKENTEKHPIFVINASHNMPSVSTITTANSDYNPSNLEFDENGNATITIDLDNMPDIEDLSEDYTDNVSIDADKEEVQQSDNINYDNSMEEAYKKLLGWGGDYMIIALISILMFSLIILVPRALLAHAIELEYRRLFEPKLKSNSVRFTPYLIPFYGGMKLCESIGADILKVISKIMGIGLAVSIINTTIMRMLGITDGIYPVISIYYNLFVFLLNYLALILLAYRTGRTIQSSLSVLFCFIPPVSFYMQFLVTRHFFKVNKDELRGTFDLK